MTETQTKFKLIGDNEFADSVVKDEWYVKDVLPKGQVGMIFGASGSGKSFWAIDLMLAIAYGKQWRNIEPKRAGVLYIAAEGANGIKKRLDAYRKRFEATLDGSMEVLDASLNLAMQADVEDLIDTIKSAQLTRALDGKQAIEIALVDTLACVSAGVDENSSAMNLIIESCKIISRETGVMIILIHHTGKDESKGARGFSGIKGAQDVEIRISGMGFNSIKKATITKQKDGEDGQEFSFKLEKVWLDPMNDPEAMSSCVIDHNVVEVDVEKKLSNDEGLALDLMKAIATGGRVLIPRLELRNKVIQAMKEKKPSEVDEDSLVALANRAIRGLMEAKRIVTDDSKSLYLPKLPEHEHF